MPVNITIRDVPDAVRDELASRAKRSGRSMQEYLVQQLSALTRRPDPAEAIQHARDFASTVPRIRIADLVDDVDADRR